VPTKTLIETNTHTDKERNREIGRKRPIIIDRQGKRETE